MNYSGSVSTCEIFDQAEGPVGKTVHQLGYTYYLPKHSDVEACVNGRDNGVATTAGAMSSIFGVLFPKELRAYLWPVHVATRIGFRCASARSGLLHTSTRGRSDVQQQRHVQDVRFSQRIRSRLSFLFLSAVALKRCEPPHILGYALISLFSRLLFRYRCPLHTLERIPQCQGQQPGHRVEHQRGRLPVFVPHQQGDATHSTRATAGHFAGLGGRFPSGAVRLR